ncbi:MAG TPA: AMP-binding protein [Vicinamibacterales bacterium]|nr:AMP-binding protein [Vicinamibacterales bacterium]
MRRDTLVDFFDSFAGLDAPFIVHDDGYRVRTYSYAQVASLARAFAERLGDAGAAPGSHVVIWSENRAEWIVALWGTILGRAVLVPVDYRASAEYVNRIAEKVSAHVVLAGQEVDRAALSGSLTVWQISDLSAGSGTPDLKVDNTPDLKVGPTPSETAEIIFTSGATADPKGVVITHRNILANVVPIEREVLKYRKYARPFRPIRFLNLLPLSHMFGQAMATFIPPMLPGVVVFIHGYHPQEIVRQIKSRRVSVLVCVPKVLDVLRDQVVKAAPEVLHDPGSEHWARRWWRYRRVHRMFGWKFWSIVVGAAPLDPELEAFWTRLGFVVVQGYGLTETAPIVTLNHPFRTSRGTVGSPIGGVEVRIAPDGEILVRGDNVTSGYYNAPGETARAFEDGWLRTGDIGSIDQAGRLTIRGRKKEMIVTPEGLNVFPEDVERALEQQSGVKEAAVVGVSATGAATEERVHAVLVLEPGANAEAVVVRANTTLEDYQRIRGVSTWPGPSLPRTEGTSKLKRREIRSWVIQGPGAAPAKVAGGATVQEVLRRFVGQRDVTPATPIEALGLSSLERVELMMALEEAFETTVDEAAFASATTVGDLERLVGGDRGLGPGDRGLGPGDRGPGPADRGAAEPIDFPSWNRSLPARAIRRVSLPTWILPIARLFAWIEVQGGENLESLEGPVIFAANHQSHMDTPAIMAALPARWRYRVAPAMAKEFFKAHFFPGQHSTRQWFTNSLNYYLAALFFNAFPLPQREAGARQTLRYIGELLGDGFSVLIFPEGRRTVEGEIQTFRPGVGMIASRLGVPVVPIRLEGLDRILHQKAGMATPGRARVAFGPPLRLSGDDFATLARQVEEAVKRL